MLENVETTGRDADFNPGSPRWNKLDHVLAQPARHASDHMATSISERRAPRLWQEFSKEAGDQTNVFLNHFRKVFPLQEENIRKRKPQGRCALVTRNLCSVCGTDPSD